MMGSARVNSRPTLLLIAPPVLHGARWWVPRVASKPHLHSLAGFVRDVADVRILELDLQEGSPSGGADALLAAMDEPLAAALEDVDLAGISCWTSLHYLGAVAVARRIRAIHPDLPIVVGGHHATAMPSDFADGERLFDFVVCGDGEQALRGLCEDLPARPPEARVVRAAPYQLSDPARIDWSTYPWHDAEQRVLWLSLSRGCPFQCTYCAEPQRGTSWNHYPVDDALGLLETLGRTHQPRVVCFADPLFGANRKWTDALLDGIRRLGLDTMFWCETRADLMTFELLDKFRECRFKVDFGLDTGSEAMVRRMAKSPSPGLYLRKAREMIGHANSIGLPHDTYVLFNFPGESPETTRETQDFVESIAGGPGPSSGWVSSQSFFILPGTETYRRMDDYHREYGTEIRHPAWWRETGDHNALATDVLPSRAWRHREHELRDFQGWQEKVNVEHLGRRSDEVSDFLRGFYGT
jgi:radical SAM superfamily enzyme YgiQ (UPF0313 family)